MGSCYSTTKRLPYIIPYEYYDKDENCLMWFDLDKWRIYVSTLLINTYTNSKKQDRKLFRDHKLKMLHSDNSNMRLGAKHNGVWYTIKYDNLLFPKESSFICECYQKRWFSKKIYDKWIVELNDPTKYEYTCYF